MKKLIFVLSCSFIIALCGCQKNDCQTFLQGEWHVVYPTDSSYIVKDSVYFYGADSISEWYKTSTSANTFRTYYSSYFITDQCDEVDFNGTNTWDSLNMQTRYHIIQITANKFQIYSFADSINCSACLVSFHR